MTQETLLRDVDTTKQRQLVQDLIKIVGPKGVFHTNEEILVYEYDASFDRHAPDAVVIPQTTAQISQIAQVAARYNIPLVARGAGTGLSGGALPREGGILVVLTRMNKIKAVDYRNRRAVVDAGTVNLALVNKVAEKAFTYAPDPSSGKASTIGGNIGANAGGPHCLAYGVTANHVVDMKVVLANGDIITTGSPLADWLGYDLTGVIVGSEGTLAVVTEATVKLMKNPEAVQTLLVIYNSIEDASESVTAILAEGILPTALEMMDGLVCRAVEAAVHAGYPEDAAGVLLIEVEGLADGMDNTMDRIAHICQQHHAAEIRRATTAAERAALWAGRKGALGSMGRIAPNYYLEDGVVPRHKVPAAMKVVAEMATKYDLPIGNFFHAGDGNIHPTILFDRRDPDVLERAKKAAVEILEACIEMGGTVSGEHGVGIEKQAYMDRLYTQDDLDAMADLKACFDPNGLLNPGKIFPPSYQPSPQSNGASPSVNGAVKATARTASAEQVASQLEAIVGAANVSRDDAAYQIDGTVPPFVVKPGSVEEISALMRAATDMKLAVAPGDAVERTVGNLLERLDMVISTERLNAVIEHFTSDLTASFQAGCTLQKANDTLGQKGQFIPIDVPLASQASLGGIVSSGPFSAGLRRLGYGTMRDRLLGMQMVRSDGRIIKRGGMVVKNVAGYDMSRLQYGALGTLGIITRINVKLQPHPENSQAVLAQFDSPAQAQQIVSQLIDSPLQPVTAALFDGALAQQVDLPAGYWLFVRFDGIEVANSRQIRDTTAWMKAANPQDVHTWGMDKLVAHWPSMVDYAQLVKVEPTEAVIRLNLAPADGGEAIPAIEKLCQEAGFRSSLLADMGEGVVWLRLESGKMERLPALQAQLLEHWPHTIVAACPAEVKQHLDVWGSKPSGINIMERIRNRFDPYRLFSPGRYVVS